MIKKLFLITLIATICAAFSIPGNVQKKADKVISKFYAIESFSKEIIEVSSEANNKTEAEFKNQNLFKIIVNEKLLGYGYIGNAPSKTADFDYLVLFDTDFIIVKSKVLIYREEYGGEIGSKRWLRQFTGESSKSNILKYNEDIIPISGATISVRSMTKAVNNLLQSLSFLQQNNEI